VFREDAKSAGVESPAAEHWLRVYGTRSRRLLELVQETPSLAQPIAGDPSYVLAELEFTIDEEFCDGIEDFLLRRSMWGLSAGQGRDARAALLRELASRLGWSNARRADEERRFLETLERMSGPLRATA
jgi:glycerol-3-phosphate dehydrogenase